MNNNLNVAQSIARAMNNNLNVAQSIGSSDVEWFKCGTDHMDNHLNVAQSISSSDEQ